PYSVFSQLNTAYRSSDTAAEGSADIQGRTEEAMTEITIDLILKECVGKARKASDTSIVKIRSDSIIKLSNNVLKELHNDAFNGSKSEDVVYHIAKVLAIVQSIKTPDMDMDSLQVHIFPLSLNGAAREWWADECSQKVIVWDWVNSKLFDHRRIDGIIIRAIWHFWLNKGNDDGSDDVLVSSDEEWEESDYGNFDINNEPYFDAHEKNGKHHIEDGDEHNIRKFDDGNLNNVHMNNEQLNKRFCKAE
ncbi:hypothetical protein Tco_1257535, partial [Tanacetum coccineum]